MSNHQDLRLIHLAKLPELRTRTGRVCPAIARSLMVAIVVDTDNGRFPITRERLNQAVGLSPAAGYTYMVLSALTLAGLVTMGRAKCAGLGESPASVLRVNLEAVAKIARLPFCHDAPIDDPQGVALRRAPAELLELRNDVCSELDAGLALIGKGTKERKDTDRFRLRAEVCRTIRRRWQSRHGVRLCDQHLAHLIGLDASSVIYAFRRFPEEKRTTAKDPRTLLAQGAPI